METIISPLSIPLHLSLIEIREPLWYSLDLNFYIPRSSGASPAWLSSVPLPAPSDARPVSSAHPCCLAATSWPPGPAFVFLPPTSACPPSFSALPPSFSGCQPAHRFPRVPAALAGRGDHRGTSMCSAGPAGIRRRHSLVTTRGGRGRAQGKFAGIPGNFLASPPVDPPVNTMKRHGRYAYLSAPALAWQLPSSHTPLDTVRGGYDFEAGHFEVRAAPIADQSDRCNASQTR